MAILKLAACSTIAAIMAVTTNAEKGRKRMGRRLTTATGTDQSTIEGAIKSMSMPLVNNDGEIVISVPLIEPIDLIFEEEDESYDNGSKEEGDVIANIIGGEQLKRGDRPYLVSFGKDVNKTYSHSCAGTLIENRVVLSAAREFEIRMVSLYRSSLLFRARTPANLLMM
jgi:hypothetical protein